MPQVPKRLLFLHPSAELYGADRTLLDLVTSLPHDGFDARVALPREGPLSEELRAHGIQVHVGTLGVVAMGDLNPIGLLRLTWQIPLAIWFVARLCWNFKPDVIHTNTMVVLGGAIAAKLCRATHLWHIHEIPTRPTWLPRVSAKLFHWLADQVVWNSHATGHTFLRHHAGLGRKAMVIHNGIDGERLHPLPDQDSARDLLGWPQDVPVAMVLGRINSWKGQSLAIDALATLQKWHPNLHLAIVGSAPPNQGHFDESLREHARKRGVESRILRHDFDTDVGQFYAACDFLILPSTRPEPFGLVVLEAFAAGRPVVASAHGGPMEIVRSGQDGLLFESGSSTDLATAMRAMLDQRDALQAMGRSAKRHQQAQFSLAYYQCTFKDLYRVLPTAIPDQVESAWPNVVHVVLGKANHERMNGVNRVVHGLASHQQNLAGRSAEVWGLCQDPDAPSPPRNYKLLTFPRYRRRSKLAPGLLARLHSMSHTPGTGLPVFHLHGAFLPEMASMARELRRLHIPYVFTPHGAYVPEAMRKNRWAKELYRFLFERSLVRGARAIQALSPDEQKSLQLRFPQTEVVCITPGQDLDLHGKPPSDPVDRELRIGCLGRIDQHTKGLDLLLDGLARYLEQGGQAHLSLAGNGRDLDSLQLRARRLGIEQSITWTGEIHRHEKRKFFHGLDIYVQLSRHEGLPGAPLEAAACACPLLVTEATHLGSLIEKHGAGWVLPDGNRDSVAATLKMAAAQSDEEWNRLGQGARTMVRHEFSWKQTAREMHRDFYGLPLELPMA
ncbi:MAG: glycosyltransferase family 4 protein, partial [Planctomycetota bacterium]|nr:glycosyltransferase family 4 protein [Planctomycetota bacterium]